jgi:15-cis-phytoene desaturase
LARVVVLGGGVAGLTVAHELAERGFSVDVIEKRDVPGGKARSTEVPSSASAGRQLLPGEHGFRFFPGFYRHLPDTFSRIPDGAGKTVLEHLVAVNTMTFAFQDRPPFVLPARFPRSLREIGYVLGFFEGVGQMGITVDDLVFTWWKLWQVVTMSHERRVAELERLSWWDYMQADSRTEAFRRLLVVGLTRNLVASRAEAANARTVGQVGIQLIRDLLTPGTSTDRILDGPTNDVWIEPWLRRLEELGVRYRTGMELERVNLDPSTGKVQSFAIKPRSERIERGGDSTPPNAGPPEVLEADYFVLAVPVEVMADLLVRQPELGRAAPMFDGIPVLGTQVEWMNGIQFYLTERVDIAHGHINHVDSEWALTTISQSQFWPKYPASSFGDGRVKTILSVDISAWDERAESGKTAKECDFSELGAETFDQVARSLNQGDKVVLKREMLHPVHPFNVDVDIAEQRRKTETTGKALLTNAEPLLVNLEDSWKLRPEVTCEVDNLFVASDYVRTYTNLATMEAANEAARAAVNAILERSGSQEEKATIFKPKEPFRFLRRRDRERLERGEGWENPLLIDSAVKLGLAGMATVLRVTAWFAALPRPLYPIMALYAAVMWLFSRYFAEAWTLGWGFGCWVVSHGGASSLPPRCLLLDAPIPSGPEQASYWYAAYMTLFGVSVYLMPRKVLGRLGFPTEQGPWLPILGATPLVMATFYATAAVFDVREFFWLSVLGRVSVFLFVLYITFARGLGSTLLIVMALPDLASALVSAWLLAPTRPAGAVLCLGIVDLVIAVAFGLFPKGLLKALGFPERTSAWVPMVAILLWFWGSYEVLAVLLRLPPLFYASALGRGLFGGFCLLSPLVYRVRTEPFVRGYRLFFVGAVYVGSAWWLWGQLVAGG